MTGISGLGLLSCLLMREVKLQDALDDTWALKESGKASKPGTAQPMVNILAEKI
jgi:hypothetical protein